MAVQVESVLSQKIYPVKGVRLATAAAALRYRNRDDLALIAIDEGATVLAAFTQNVFAAAPVLVCREHLGQANPRALLINSGIANAGTGEKGKIAAYHSCQLLAQALALTPECILPFSTGIIMQIPDVHKIAAALPSLICSLHEDHWQKAAKAIMTTDTLPKVVSLKVPMQEGEITITGMAKGVGMIQPNMATLLSFIATDAKIQPGKLQTIFHDILRQSFNAISVDGDTSTNDSCVLIASGQGPNVGENEVSLFKKALLEVFQRLAWACVRDGEGATKFITLKITGGKDADSCFKVARSIANSPLVKTAFFASDPNLGRILAAAGNACVAFDPQKVSLKLGDLDVLIKGNLLDYREEEAQAMMAKEVFTITLDLGQGDATASFWTCDFSYDYVRINAEYRS